MLRDRARRRDQTAPAAALGMCRVFARGPDGGGKHKYLLVPEELCAAHAHPQGVCGSGEIDLWVRALGRIAERTLHKENLVFRCLGAAVLEFKRS